MSKKSLGHLAPVLAERDGGWICHYCGIRLIPNGTPSTDWHFYQVRWTLTRRPWTGVLRPETPDVVYFWPQLAPRPGFRHAHVDHVIPRALGGTNARENLVLACDQCNMRKNAKPLPKFTTEQQAGDRT